ncbi:WbqC family protein [Nostoc sp.]|uniref:WbqC family protein n=1 Tax=Nostoc sp. TaxID=1180 RepID=UPI002FF8D4C8
MTKQTLNANKNSTIAKRVGIIQSSYIPWRGYFDFIDSVDLFVIYDDVQYSKGSWRNRNQVKTKTSLKWLTVPVITKMGLTIDQVLIAKDKHWQDTHYRLLYESLGSAPFFMDIIQIWEAGIAAEDITISQLNIRLIKLICSYLQISTPIVMSHDYIISGKKTERLIHLLQKLGAKVYLSGPTAQGYLDENMFREHGIFLEYKTYDYDPYPQLWGDFVGAVSVLDLIANMGQDARHFLKSKTPNIIVV